MEQNFNNYKFFYSNEEKEEGGETFYINFQQQIKFLDLNVKTRKNPAWP